MAGSHFYIPVGDIKSAKMFCTSKEKVKDRSLKTINIQHNTLPHPLEVLNDSIPPDKASNAASSSNTQEFTWDHIPLQARLVALYHFRVKRTNTNR